MNILQDEEDEEEINGGLPSSREYLKGLVVSIVKSVVKKLKISLILPIIFEYPLHFHKILEGTQHEECANQVIEYMEKEKYLGIVPPSRPSFLLLNIIDYLHENAQIFDMLSEWHHLIAGTEKKIMDSYVQLCMIAQQRFQVGGREKLLIERHFLEAHHENEKYKKFIRNMISKIEGRKYNTMWKTAAKSGRVKDLEEEWDLLEVENKLKIKDKVTQSGKDIKKLHQTFLVKQKEFDDDLKNIRSKYDTVLKKDLKMEKQVRAEKNKYQLQLEALLKKYVETMHEKEVEESEVNRQYDELSSEYAVFVVDYNRELQAYEELVVHWEKIQLEKIYKFTIYTAARRIQRWWKRILKRKRKKNKAKKAAEAKKWMAGIKPLKTAGPKAPVLKKKKK